MLALLLLWSAQALATPAAGHEGPSPAALDKLLALEGRAPTLALIELIDSGLPDASTDRILQRWVDKPRPEALDALERMAGHRRPEARVLALRAIAALGMADAKLGPSTSKVLAAALRDSDARVRGTAASALGQRFERIDQDAAKKKVAPAHESVVEVLLHATARGVPEAARAAGLAVTEAQLPKLHEALRGMPMTATLDAYDAALARRTLSEAAKLDVIARLGEIATPATKTFLSTLIAKNRFPLNSRLQRALIETEKQIAPRPAASGGKP